MPKQSTIGSFGRLGGYVSVLVVFASISAWKLSAQSTEDFFTGRAGIQNAIYALYGDKDSSPTVIIRVQNIHTDFEKRGFFKIGTLPVLVMEGISFQLSGSDAAAGGLAEVHKWLNPRSGSRIELHNVSFETKGAITNRLAAGRARIGVEGRLELSGGVTFVSGSNRVAAATGTFQITGKESGRLVVADRSKSTNNLFAAFPAKSSIEN